MTWLLSFFIFSALASELPSDSLFTNSTYWRDQEGRSVQLKDLQGTPLILTMTYTGCQYSCPMTLKKLEEIEAVIKKDNVQNYRFIIFSFDPINDTPKVLKKYMQKRKLNSTHWTFLTAKSDSEVREISLLLGISYQREGKREFSHSNGFSLLNKAGQITTQLKSLNADAAELIKNLELYAKTP